jgi:hypothetical protein
LKDAWRAGGVVAGRFAEEIPPNHAPPEQPTFAAPRLVELAFQTAGLAEIAGSERMGLPHAFRRLDLMGPGGDEAGAAALATPLADGTFDVDVTDARGHLVMSLKGYRTAALPQPVEAEAFGVLKE